MDRLPSFDRTLEIMLQANQAHRLSGGREMIKITGLEFYAMQNLPDSPYVQAIFPDNSLSEMKLFEKEKERATYHESEVYRAIMNYALSCWKGVKVSVATREAFPKRRWGERIPLHSIDVITSNLDKMKDLLSEERKNNLREITEDMRNKFYEQAIELLEGS